MLDIFDLVGNQPFHNGQLSILMCVVAQSSAVRLNGWGIIVFMVGCWSDNWNRSGKTPFGRHLKFAPTWPYHVGLAITVNSFPRILMVLARWSDYWLFRLIGTRARERCDDDVAVDVRSKLIPPFPRPRCFSRRLHCMIDLAQQWNWPNHSAPRCLRMGQ